MFLNLFRKIEGNLIYFNYCNNFHCPNKTFHLTINQNNDVRQTNISIILYISSVYIFPILITDFFHMHTYNYNETFPTYYILYIYIYIFKYFYI